jgi:hypothetical protein
MQVPNARYSVRQYTTPSNHNLPPLDGSKYIALNIRIKTCEQNRTPPGWSVWRHTVTAFVEVPVEANVRDFRDVENLTIHGRGLWDMMGRLTKQLPFRHIGSAWNGMKPANKYMEIGVPFAGPDRSVLYFRQRPDPLAGTTLTNIGDIDHVLSCTRRHIHQFVDWMDVLGIVEVTISFLGARDPSNKNNFWTIDRQGFDFTTYPFDSLSRLGCVRKEVDAHEAPVNVIFIPAKSGQHMFSCSR